MGDKRNKKFGKKHKHKWKPLRKENLKNSEGSTDHLTPHFSFDYCDKSKFTFEELNQQDKASYLNLLHTMGSCKWNQIFTANGFDTENRKQNTIKCKAPRIVPEDVPILRIRVDLVRRIWGYREGRTYHIIWFDKGHKVDDMS